MARLQAVVVLPSLGSADVITTAFGGSSTSTYCRFVRIVRKPSARTDCWFRATNGVLSASGSNITRPRFVRPVRAAISDSLLTLVSNCSRRIA